MENQQLIDFIKHSRQASKPDSQIRQELLDTGWPAEHIDNVLNILEKDLSQPPRPPLTINGKLPGVFLLLKEAFSAFRKRFWKTIGLFALPVLMFASMFVLNLILALILGQKALAYQIVSIVILFVGGIAAIYVSICSSGAILKLADKTIPLTFKQAFSEGKKKGLSFVVIGLLTFLVSLGGYVLLIVPGIIFSLYFSFSAFVLFHEDLKGRQALIRSKELVKGNWWQIFYRVFLASIIIILPVFILVLILTLIKFNPTVVMIINYAYSFLISPVLIFYNFLLFNYLREIKGPPKLTEPISKLVKYIVVGVFGMVIIPIVTVYIMFYVLKPLTTIIDLAQIVQIQKTFDRRDYNNAVVMINTALKDTQPTNDNMLLFALRAQSKMELGDKNGAEVDYKSILPLIDKMFNTEQRRYDFVFFDLGKIYMQRNDFQNSENYYKKGLIINSSNVAASLELGQVYENRGQIQKAIDYYQQLKTSISNSEAQFLITIKLDELSKISPAVNGITINNIYELYPIRVYPLDQNPIGINLNEVCDVLEIRFSQNCNVMPSLSVDYSKINRLETNNDLDSSQLISELQKMIPERERQGYVTLAITGEYIGTEGANYLFSFQDYDKDISIISLGTINRFLPQITERGLVLNRRVALQAISATGQILGFTRNESPICPLANVNGYDEFTNRKTVLCGEDPSGFNKQLEQNKNFRHSISPQKTAEISEVYKKYYLDRF